MSSVLAAALVVAGCGGSQTPAESPEATPGSTEETPPPTQPAPEGEHTMPDGTKMPGHQHGEHEQPPDAPQ
jgi:hypothetical protein